MLEFKMPSLGADMESATLVEWLVKPGDKVKRGDVMAAIEVAKGVFEIEVFEDGIVDQILVDIDDEVEVGTVLAMLRAVDEEAVPVAAVAAVAEPAAAVATTNGRRLRVTPLARRVAEELGVDLYAVEGTGSRGAITREDVEDAAKALKEAKPAKAEAPPAKEKPAKPPAEKPKKAVDKASPEFQLGMRQAIAAAMAKSNREIPHYYLETHIDMTNALNWLQAENAKRSIKERLLPALLLIKAVAHSLVDVPQLNGYWADDAFQQSEAIHIGFAIALRQGGLITPAIHHADLKTWDELRETLADIIIRTRSGRLRGSEMTDPTITVTSLGDLGVETVFGVIYPPQVALVGFGTVTETPVAVNGMLGVRPMLTATLAADHRASDGRIGAQFLDALNKHLQEVENL